MNVTITLKRYKGHKYIKILDFWSIGDTNFKIWCLKHSTNASNETPKMQLTSPHPADCNKNIQM